MIITLSKGQQLTIPADMRNELGLKKGSKVEVIKKGNQILLRPVGDDLEKVFAEAKILKPRRRLTVEEMEKMNEEMFR